MSSRQQKIDDTMRKRSEAWKTGGSPPPQPLRGGGTPPQLQQPQQPSQRHALSGSSGIGSSSSATLCQCCNEPMGLCEKEPTILIPCGHTFCRACVIRVHSKNPRQQTGNCPTCRADISATAVNHSLKQMIPESANTPFASSASGMARASASREGSAGGGGSEESAPLEGPLPAVLRQQIESIHAPPDTRAQADTYARRYLSNRRRLKVYMEELQAAGDEETDLAQRVRRSQIVFQTLQAEVTDIDKKIAALTEERRMVVAQMDQVEGDVGAVEGQCRESARRVDALRQAVEKLSGECRRGEVLLQQLVPGINLDSVS